MTTAVTPPEVPARPPLRRARRWVLGVGLVLSLVAILWGVLLMINLLGRTTETTTSTLRSTSDLLTVSGSGGDIRIVGGDVPDVRVTTTVTYGLGKPGLRQDDGPDGVHLGVSCPWWSFVCSSSYDIVVPRRFAVQAQSSGGSIEVNDVTGRLEVESSGGSITARGVAGAVRATSSGGSVRLEDVGGPVDLHSSGGSITGTGLRGAEATAESSGGGVRLQFATAPQRVEATSSGGSVDVQLPRVDGGYDVDADVSGGSQSIGVPTDPDSARKIAARSSGGSVRVVLTPPA